MEERKLIFAPGCTLRRKKPHIVDRLHAYLREALGDVGMESACCRAGAGLPEGATVVVVCRNCVKTYTNRPEKPQIRLIWEIVEECLPGTPFPDLEQVRAETAEVLSVDEF